MLEQRRAVQKNQASSRTVAMPVYSSELYHLVFEARFVKYAVFILLCFLLLQPVAPASAAFTEGEDSDEQAFQAEEPKVLEVENDDVSNGQGIVETQNSAGSDAIADEDDQAEGDTQAQDTADSDEEQTSSSADEESEEVSTGDPSLPEAETETETLPNDDAEVRGNDSEDIDEIDEDDTLGSVSTTSEIVIEQEDDQDPDESIDDEGLVQVEDDEATDEMESATTSTDEVLIVEHSTSELQFNPNDCASVGDGAFYCSTRMEETKNQKDGVFAAPDADGDLEIYVRLFGEERKVTSNLVDDSAPYYDALSERIVWHARYNDRYQVVSYDMNTHEEVHVTDTNYNNMEPVAYGEITMWQSWINNNWEIMLHDGDTVRQLTDNAQHDVSPSIRGGYIVWQTQTAEGWQVAVYDQETEHIEYVQSEGGKVENPCFVLVYDSTNDAGDVQTVGYDFDKKESFTLNSQPADLPDELPEPDQTGETRALIQNKHTVRIAEIEEGEPVPVGGSSTSTSSATSTDSLSGALPPGGGLTLDLSAATSSENSRSATSSDASIEELVITNTEPVVDDISTDTIPDIVIPPLQATSTAEVR